jgi:hypothetical protein
MTRNEFLKSCVSLVLLFSPRRILGAEQEISANLELKSEDVLQRKSRHQIFHDVLGGESHSHEVVINVTEWKEILAQGKAVVRSSPGGKDFHWHWVLVKTKGQTSEREK